MLKSLEPKQLGTHMTAGNQLSLSEIKALCTNALTKNDWHSLYEAAQKFDLKEVPIISRYYQLYALYQLANRALTPEIIHKLHETLELIYLPPCPQNGTSIRPSVPDKVHSFLMFLLAQKAYEKQDYQRAYLLYLYVGHIGVDKDYEETNQALTYVIILLHHFGYAEWAFQRLYYAEPKYLVPSLLAPILNSPGYKNFATTAQRFQVEHSYSGAVEIATSNKDAQRQMQAVRYRMVTPIEAFANTEIDYPYPYQLQNTPCVLLIEQNIEWQGNFNTNDIVHYLGGPLTETPYIILIKGNFNCSEMLVCNPQEDFTLSGFLVEKEKIQFIVHGNVSCKVFYNRQYVAVRGVLTSRLTVFDGPKTALQVTLLDTPYFYLRQSHHYSLEVEFKDKQVRSRKNFYWNSSWGGFNQHFFVLSALTNPKDWDRAFVEDFFESCIREMSQLTQKMEQSYHIHLMNFKPNGEPYFISEEKFLSAFFNELPLTKQQLEKG